MCRFVAYHGPKLPLDELLYKPEHSIIHQSTHSTERREPLNGDGWGVGWYAPEESPHPARYRTVRPAWTDENMRHVSPAIRTPAFLSHVRAASPGLAVQQLNCHPFRGGQHDHEEPDTLEDLEFARRKLLFMHNGQVGAYKQLIRTLTQQLPDDLFFSVRGSTDSELVFAVIQDYLAQDAIDPTLDDLHRAVEDSLGFLDGLKAKVGQPEAETHANFCMTNGERMIATRYAHPDPETAPSLYVGQAREFYCDDEHTFATRGPEGTGATLIVSERLFEDDRVWRKVPLDHAVHVDSDGDVEFVELDVAS